VAASREADQPITANLQAGVNVFAAAPDGIVVVDDAGIITSVNDQAGEMFGYPPAELVGEAIEVLLPERFREGHVSNRKSYSAHPTRRPMGLTLALYGRRRNGEEFPVDISLNYERSAGDRLRVIAFVRDATARKRMEEELKTTEQNFRLLVDGIGDHALLMLDPSGNVVTWNPGAQRIKGWTAEEILGRHFSAFYLPEDVAAGQPERDLERAAAEGRAQSEGWRVRAGGQRFWAETTLSAMRDDTGTLRGFAKVTRDRTEQHHTRARLESIGALNRAVLEQRPEDELLALVVSRARAMVSASLVVAWAPTPAGDGLTVTSAEGDGASALLGSVAPDDGIVTNAARTLRVELVPDLRADARVPRSLVDAGLESGLFVPLHAAGEMFGVLGVMTARGREPLQAHDADLLQAFGGHAAASFAHARARHAAEQLHLVADRERIARDLHDTVIQRLFAVGLSLEATGRRPAPETQERIHQAVADIDDTIRSIRSSIFGLEARAEEQAKLRGRVLEVVADAAPTLGFEPSVRFDGPVDTLATNEITDNLVAVLREALSNVAQHARATSTNVTISAGDEMVLVVDDDGVGSGTFARGGGHGVVNLQERARMLGGCASVESVEPHGTRVEWRVPTGS
jgi:PAS domain S-box-containing protein